MPRYEVTLSEACFPAQADSDVREITVGALLRETAARRSEAEALVEVRQTGEIGRRRTYAVLLAESERSGARAGVTRFRPGERVVVWAPNSPEWVLMEYACALAGLVLVTANPAYQVRELRYVLEQSGAVALFLVEEFRGNPMAEIGAQAADGLAAVREICDMGDAAALHAVADPAGSAALPEIAPGDAAQIQYTSGTTGFPKGAVLSHRGLVNNARYYAGRCGVTERTTWINPMPMFHTSGCGMLTLGSLQAGCRMVLMSLFDPHVLVGVVESERASIALGVPTMILAMLDAYDASPRDVSSLELVCSGGAMVAPELVRAFNGPSVARSRPSTGRPSTARSSPSTIATTAATTFATRWASRCRGPTSRSGVWLTTGPPPSARSAKSVCAGHASCWAITATPRRPPMPSTAAAGCIRATSGSWMRAATSRSPAG